MPTKEVNVSRAGADDPSATLKAHVQARFMAAMEKKAALQLAEVPAGLPYQWEVFGFGPWQNPSQQPGRIIAVGQTAFIATVVWMNPLMCSTVAGFGADILLNYWTYNTQTVRPVPSLNYQGCIEPGPVYPFGCFNVDIWEFTPTEPACLCETNICARLCNCDGRTVPGYAAFVRWVYDFDPDLLWPAGVRYDNPIRYMVYDPDEPCSCP